jgi:hypothetical protein
MVSVVRLEHMSHIKGLLSSKRIPVPSSASLCFGKACECLLAAHASRNAILQRGDVVVLGLREMHLAFRLLRCRNDFEPYGNLRHLLGERDFTGGLYDESGRFQYEYVVHAYIWGSERLCCGALYQPRKGDD